MGRLLESSSEHESDGIVIEIFYATLCLDGGRTSLDSSLSAPHAEVEQWKALVPPHQS